MEGEGEGEGEADMDLDGRVRRGWMDGARERRRPRGASDGQNVDAAASFSAGDSTERTDKRILLSWPEELPACSWHERSAPAEELIRQVNFFYILRASLETYFFK